MDARRSAFVLFADHFLNRSGSEEEDSDEEFEPDFINVYDVRSSDEEEEEENRPTFGGYDYEFVDKVLDSQTCPVCLLPMRDAVQTTECGHRFCKGCLEGILRYIFCVLSCNSGKLFSAWNLYEVFDSRKCCREHFQYRLSKQSSGFIIGDFQN